jgi:glutathione reductase (NADPH)
MTYDYDLFVIGAGSGGVRAARIAAGHGAKVAVAEEYRVGGTCVIRGCVPKKLLVYGSHFAEDLEDGRNYGWNIEGASFDWPSLRDHVLRDVDRLNSAYTDTLANNNVESILQRAEIVSAHEIRLVNGQKITAKYILIATGAWPDMPAFEGNEHALTSNDMFHLTELPKRMLVFGGGYIANEFAGIFNGLGSKVTLFNRSETMLRTYDQQIVDRLIQISLAKGINICLNTTITKITKLDDGSLLVFDNQGKDPIAVDVVLVATGRHPKIEGLGLENAGVKTNDKGAIIVDAEARTNVDTIFAVGDVTDRVQLTPVAIREGHAFADRIFGNENRAIDYSCIPSAVFSQPPIASVGLTEQEARQTYPEIKVYSSDFRAMKNVFAHRAERSLYKMICDANNGKILGIHMISPEAPEILQIAAIALKAGLTKQDFDDTVALHPSMAEELVLLK